MTRSSPFSPMRHEQAGQHVYYLPRGVLQQFESDKNIYLVGARGTGKTTLLKAMDWRERLTSPSLRAQLGGKPFETKEIGTYIKLPHVQFALLDRWLRKMDDDVAYADYLAYYLDLVWLEMACDAIEELRRAGVLTPDENSVTKCGTAFADWFRDFPSGAAVVPPGAISDTSWLCRAFRLLRLNVEVSAKRGLEPDLAMSDHPTGAVGDFGRRAAPLLAQLCDASSTPRTRQRWRFRVCFDEAEILNSRQQKALNSLLRVAEWPVFFVVAYVSTPTDITSTVNERHTLGLADRQVIVRDTMSDKEFADLAEGVATARVRDLTGDPTATVDLEVLLGSLDIDGYLERILKESVTSASQELLSAAEARRVQQADTSAGAGHVRLTRGGARSAPPIYETFLEQMHLADPLEDVGGTKRRRALTSAQRRKRMVAAYLTICREVAGNARPIYASRDMVLQICDNCVRDFLWQMDALFEASHLPLADWLRTRLPVEAQDKALLAASEAKMVRLKELVPTAPAQARQVVDALARVTAIIQSSGQRHEQLRSTERGVFSYEPTADPEGLLNARLLVDAAEAGYLKLLRGDNGEFRFRVHASLAPKYEFSYRGAYYAACRLDALDLRELRETSDPGHLARLAQRIASRITDVDGGDMLQFDWEATN